MDEAELRDAWSVPADRSGVPTRVTLCDVPPRRPVRTCALVNQHRDISAIGAVRSGSTTDRIGVRDSCGPLSNAGHGVRTFLSRRQLSIDIPGRLAACSRRAWLAGDVPASRGVALWRASPDAVPGRVAASGHASQAMAEPRGSPSEWQPRTPPVGRQPPGSPGWTRPMQPAQLDGNNAVRPVGRQPPGPPSRTRPMQPARLDSNNAVRPVGRQPHSSPTRTAATQPVRPMAAARQTPRTAAARQARRRQPPRKVRQRAADQAARTRRSGSGRQDAA